MNIFYFGNILRKYNFKGVLSLRSKKLRKMKYKILKKYIKYSQYLNDILRISTKATCSVSMVTHSEI